MGYNVTKSIFEQTGAKLFFFHTNIDNVIGFYKDVQ